MSSFLWDAVVGRLGSLGLGVERPLRLTTKGSLGVALVESAGTERLRGAVRFVGGCQIIANGIAPVSAIPTTTATLALYNTSATKSLVVDWLSYSLGSGTAAAGATLFAGVSAGVLSSAPSAATGYSSQNANTSTTATAAGRWATAVTFPANTAWVAAAPQMQLAAANVGQGGSPVTGGLAFLVPPACALGFGILSGAGTSPLYIVSAAWDEYVLDVE